MQIDRYNFPEYFAQISDKLKQASFVSFDCEFTGLVTNLEKIEGKFADYQEFYERIKQTALNFKILQMGFTAFIYNNDKRYYEPFSYNFYVLPNVNLSQFNNVMVAEVESLAFLSQHGIDWNRIFKNGIIPQRLLKPFQYKRHQYDDCNQSKGEYFFGPLDQSIIEKIESVLERISQKNIKEVIDFQKNSIYKRFNNKYMDKIILEKKKTSKKFEFLVSFIGQKNDDKNDDIVFQKTQEPIKQAQQDMIEQKMDVQLQNPTIEELLKIISDRQIPIVGHYPNLDIGLIYHTYFEALPQKYEEFSQKITKLFPFIYDTKILSRRVAFNFKGMKVSLENLYAACRDPKYLKNYSNVIECKNAIQNDNRHEAGYDSYLTGYVFVGMANYIIKNNKGDAINFKQFDGLNCLIYSRETGEISLREPYTSLTREYQRKIVIWNESKTNQKWRLIAQKLSFYGTLYVAEDHKQTYFVFEEENDNITHILKQLSQVYGLKHYDQRKIPRARDIYSRTQQQLYYN